MEADNESFSERTPNTLRVRPQYFFGINGYHGRCNDALFKPSILAHPEQERGILQKTLVYFGGDIQNFMHLMDQDDESLSYRRWCLETAAIRLGKDYPNHHIIVIKPTRITFDHISCFDNFVDGNCLGIPSHMYRYVGVPHLESLLKNMSKFVRKIACEELCKILFTQQEEEDYLDAHDLNSIVWRYDTMSTESRSFIKRWQRSLSLHKYPLTLVAFSKGCVVLNQFLYEFHFAKRLEPRMQDSSFIDRIEDMYYLDAGHAGPMQVYLDSRGLLRTVTELGINIKIHTSQYQLDDKNRRHIRTQWDTFIKTLKELKANLQEFRHLSATTDIEAHFGVLCNFKDIQHSSVEVREPPLVLRPRLPPPTAASTASTNVPAPPLPRTTERNFMLEEVLGISLIKHSCSPHFGMHTILRRPLNEIMKNIMASGRATGDTVSEITEDVDAVDADSQIEEELTRMDQISQDILPQNMDIFAQAPGTSLHANTSQVPGTWQAPETLQPVNPSPVPSTSRGSRPSQTQQPRYGDYDVCMTVKNDRFNFRSDEEAIQMFENAKYFKTDYPIVAIPHNRDERPGIDIFIPEERVHVARVMNRLAPDFVQRMERAAATPRSSLRVDSPPAVSVPNNVEPSPRATSQNILLSALQGVRAAQWDDAFRPPDFNRLSSIQRTASYPWIVANDAPWAYSSERALDLSSSRTNAMLHVNIALNDSARDLSINGDSGLAPNSQPGPVSNPPDVVMQDPLQLNSSQAQIANNMHGIAGTSGTAGGSLGSRWSTDVPGALRVRRNSDRATSTPYNLQSMRQTRNLEDI